jgi:hypothetical protein
MVEKLLGMADGRFVVPIVVVIGLSVLIKGLFSLNRSKSQDRKDFLEVWGTREAPDDLWLEVAVRHQFGEYLPASLIRSLQRSPQAGRALLDVAQSWDLLEMHDETGEVGWRVERHKNPRRRLWERRGFVVLYFCLMSVGLMLVYLASIAGKGSPFGSWVAWLYVILLIGSGMWCLARHETLGVAERSMSRWLGGS